MLRASNAGGDATALSYFLQPPLLGTSGETIITIVAVHAGSEKTYVWLNEAY